MHTGREPPVASAAADQVHFSGVRLVLRVMAVLFSRVKG
jgi:hypothetical protein